MTLWVKPTLSLLLIRILARTDALWLPPRAPSEPQREVRRERQCQLDSIGVPMPLPNTDAVAASDEISALADARWLRIYQLTDGIVAGVHLGLALEDALRRHACLSTFENSLAILPLIERMTKAHHARADLPRRAWLSECAIIGRDYTHADTTAATAMLEVQLLPVLGQRAWLLSASDDRGHVSYSLTDDGRDGCVRLDDLAIEPAIQANRPDPAAHVSYLEELAAARAELAAADPIP